MANKRPGIITAICILGFIGVAFTIFTIPMIFSNFSNSIGTWYPPYVMLSAIVGLVCMIGLWMMKKWSIIAYTIFVAINQIVFITAGVWNLFTLIIPAVIIALGFSKFKDMD